MPHYKPWLGKPTKTNCDFPPGWNRLPLAQQWLDKHGVEPIKRRFEAFQQENPTAASGLGRAGSV
jgi:hypothetical protein